MMDGPVFDKKIIPILTPCFNFVETKERSKYFEYWMEQLKNAEKEVKELDGYPASCRENIEKDVILYSKILESIGFLFSKIEEMNSYDLIHHQKTNFQAIKDLVKISPN